MADDITTKRMANPDYKIDVHIVGVRLGMTGKTRWRIEVDGESDSLRVAEIMDRAALVLRGEAETD